MCEQPLADHGQGIKACLDGLNAREQFSVTRCGPPGETLKQRELFSQCFSQPFLKKRKKKRGSASQPQITLCTIPPKSPDL